MTKLIILNFLIILFIILIAPLSLAPLIKHVPSGVQPSLRGTEKIYGDNKLSQSFISLEDNLSGIGTSIKNPNYANKKDLNIKILDEENNILRSIKLNGHNIADGEFVKIMFDPILDSRNKKYIWSIEAADSKFEDALEIFLTDDKVEWALGLSAGERGSDYNLSFVTFHKVSPSSVLIKIVSEWYGNFKADIFFFVFYLVVVLGIITSLIFLHFSKKN